MRIAAPSGNFVIVLGMTDMIGPARATIAQHYGELLAACDRLREFAVGMLSPWGGQRHLEEDSPHEQLLVMVLSRSLTVFRE